MNDEQYNQIIAMLSVIAIKIGNIERKLACYGEILEVYDERLEYLEEEVYDGNEGEEEDCEC